MAVIKNELIHSLTDLIVVPLDDCIILYPLWWTVVSLSFISSDVADSFMEFGQFQTESLCSLILNGLQRV